MEVGEVGIHGREKVIKGLEICTTRPCYCTDCPYKKECCLDSQNVMEDALALLKEHEPAEPDPTEHIVFGTNRKCSSCGKYLFPAGKFCPHCGRQVKWDE